MNVVSLFNGMNTGRQALENIGIKVKKYYSSEIKPYAIELTQYHFPDTIQVGDVTKWREWDIDWSSIDLILSGSPCQDLSAAGKRAGIHGAKSSLFFTFVDILNHIKSLNPNVLFLQENVGSASKLDVGIMSRALGVYPVRINSKLVTAQLRDRYYWSNIKTKQDGLFGDIVTDIPQPEDRGIMFKDIITSGYVERVKSCCLMESISRIQHTQNGIKSRENYGVPQIYVDKDKANCLLEGDYKMFIKDEIKQDEYLKKRIKKGKQTPNLVYVDTDKHVALKMQGHRDNQGSQEALKHRNETTGMITLIYEVDNELRCKTNTNKGFDVVTENDCINLAFPNSTSRRGRVTKGKAPCLTKVVEPLYSYKDGIVRTVNKVEMCRLQGFPDDYCDILSTAKAGSLLGDGWTLPVIEHIFSFIK
jgi:DNA (cytosine-5)-methyltransferase 3A